MPHEEPTAPEATLGDVLSRRARRTPAGRLRIDIVGGVAVALAAAWARPPGVVILLSGGLCLACYGAWATAERRLFDTPWQLRAEAERAWRAVRSIAAPLGLLSFLAFLFGLLSLGLGRWSS